MKIEIKQKIVLITVDCLRFDSTKYLANPIFKYKWLNHYATAPFTSGSFKSLFYGELPLSGESGLAAVSPANSIAQHFFKQGFCTVGIHSNPYLKRLLNSSQWSNLIDVTPDNKINNSFENLIKKSFNKLNIRYDNRSQLLNQNYTANASQITKRAIKEISRNKSCEKMFLWVHYMDAHFPYNVNSFNRSDVDLKMLIDLYKRFQHSRIVKNDIPLIKEIYSNALTYIKGYIDRLVNKIQKEWQYPIIILTSDHGEGMLEHDFVSHQSYFFDELMHVPLMSNYPIFNNEKFTSHINLYSRLWKLANNSTLNLPEETCSYQKVLHDEFGLAVPMEVFSDFNNDKDNPKLAIRTTDKKYIYDNNQVIYYDLIRDYLETQPIDCSDYNNLKTIFKDRYNLIMSRHNPKKSFEEADETLVKRFQELGYM